MADITPPVKLGPPRPKVMVIERFEPREMNFIWSTTGHHVYVIESSTNMVDWKFEGEQCQPPFRFMTYGTFRFFRARTYAAIDNQKKGRN